MIDEHIPLVKYIARSYRRKLPPNILLEDLIQEGMIGLIDAEKKYDPDNGASFISYAKIRIKGAMKDCMRKTDIASRPVRRQYREFGKARVELEEKLQRMVMDKEVAEHLNMSPQEVVKMLSGINSANSVSYDLLTSETEDDVIINPSHDRIIQEDCSAEGICINDELSEQLKQALDRLPLREKQMFEMSYSYDLSYAVIGERFGVSEQMVGVIITRAKTKLKRYMVDWY